MTLRDTLWEQVPSLYRRRDADNGDVLRALLDIIGEQAEAIEDDIRRLYDNWFIETCEPWALPYIGDLVGYTGSDISEPALDGAQAAALQRVLTPRRDVANSVRNRRRKGSVALLEDIVGDVAGWSGRIVEFSARAATTVSIDHVRVSARGTVDVRDYSGLARLGEAGDQFARVADVGRSGGRRFGPHGIGVLVARLEAFPLTRSDAYCVDEEGSRCFTFDALGRDVPLFRAAHPRVGVVPPHLPGPITRAVMMSRSPGDPQLYGERCDLMIWRRGRDQKEFEPIPPAVVTVADLADWRHRPEPGTVAVDPERGRIAFPDRESPERLLVSYHYGFAAALGGGEYPRRMMPAQTVIVYRIGRTQEAHDSLHSALAQWGRERPMHAVIEFQDSHIYDEAQVQIELRDRHLQIRAADGARPVLRLANYESGAQDALRVSGGRGSSLTIDGLTIAGRGLAIRGQLDDLVIRHATLVPGGSGGSDARQGANEFPSVAIENCGVRLTIDHSIIGPVAVRSDERNRPPVPIVITDSIVDAGGPQREAFPTAGQPAHVALEILRSTVFGRIEVHSLTLAENSLFTAQVRVLHRQSGCVRFCFLPPASVTPHCFECVPTDRAPHGPVFVSRRYGHPGYAQLAAVGPASIARGADDQSEIGVFHNLFQPQREANLRRRLEEALPVSNDFDLVYMT